MLVADGSKYYISGIVIEKQLLAVYNILYVSVSRKL